MSSPLILFQKLNSKVRCIFFKSFLRLKFPVEDVLRDLSDESLKLSATLSMQLEQDFKV